MTTNQLVYFCAAAEKLNFTKAAEECFISQTAITQQIQNLESILGAQLFIRNKKKVELTPAGTIFYNEAKAILERTNTAFEKVRTAADGYSGELRIGYTKGYERTDFSGQLRRFHSAYPNVSVLCTRENTAQLYEDLKKGCYDIAFCLNMQQLPLTEMFEIRKVQVFPLIVALSRNHPFASRPRLTRKDLKGETFLVLDESEEWLQGVQEEPLAIVAKSPDIESVLLMVSAEMGIAILPEYAITGAQNSSELVFVPLTDQPDSVEVAAIWQKENRNPALENFQNCDMMSDGK